ncbi:DEAD/DEAH box helicase [Flavobacterium sandaracinum]|uniref:DNA helicase n=1 Tax=Flavobacterium sandaracinum TaxID=2541733 RepID=A0A4R5D7J4_9FLAO|nr:DEAD/DEAH box helicase [Flavobacterium sandaracinum]TDE07691.1 DNA helicase [Flavobacterium sandaracinum]
MTTIENIDLDKNNVEFNNASEFVKHTDKLIYLTGKAGTGKTTFLKSLKNNTTKNAVILAPTGVAAINAGGQTIHSFFHLPFGPFVVNDKRLRSSKELGDLEDTTIYSTFKYKEEKKIIIKQLELLIIDEISMVRCDTLDVIDKILRVFRQKPFLPFGGVQVILIGDTFQLPPIADFAQWEILKNYYESPFFFSSKVVIENKPVYIELKKIYRQKEQEFIDLLNKIRVNQINDLELNDLNKKYNPTFSSNGINNHIILSTTNAQVNQTNATKLDEIKSETKIFEGKVTGIFPKDSKGSFVLPTEQNLHLKVGAQIMILKNDSGEFKRYFNGRIGKVLSLEDDKIIVEFSDESKVQVEKTSWNNIQYVWNKEKRKIEETTIGTFTQYPLRLAWAITVHKSQGLTFEHVYADLGNAFEDGQVYVALSRCTSLSGLVLKSQIPRNKIRTNNNVIEFAKTETPSTLIVQELNSGKADYFYRRIREDIKTLNFNEAYNNFIKALKFRNDIETEIFKKYFVTTASKFVSYKSKQQFLFTDYQVIKSEKEEIKAKLLINENENIEFESKIEEQNRGLKILLEKTRDHEKLLENELHKTKKLNSEIIQLKSENEKYKSENLTYKTEIQHLENKKNELKKIKETKVLEINLLNKENIKLENKISNFENEIIGLKTKQNILEDINRKNEIEIERQKNLKWYQKLVGKK